jgi:hypothetical protein
MLRYFLIGYLVVYFVFMIMLFTAYKVIVPKEDKKKDKPWETPLDIAMAVAGLGGMIFLLIDFQSATAKIIWRPLSVALLLGQIYLCVRSRVRTIASGEVKPGEPEAKIADIVTLLFLLPSLCLNIYWAFR